MGEFYEGCEKTAVLLGELGTDASKTILEKLNLSTDKARSMALKDPESMAQILGQWLRE